MTSSEAHEILGSRPGDSLTAIEERFESERKVWSGKLTAAVLPKHTEQCQQRLREIEEAVRTLRMEAPPPASPPAPTPAANPVSPPASAPSAPPRAPEGLGDMIKQVAKDKIADAGGKLVKQAKQLPRSEYKWLIPSIGVSLSLVLVWIGFNRLKSGTKHGEGSDVIAHSSATPLDKGLIQIAELLKKGDLPQAAIIAAALLKDHPEDRKILQIRDELIGSLSKLAGEFVGNGNNINAVECYRLVVDLSPNHPLAATALDQMNRIGAPQGRTRIATAQPGARVTLYRLPDKGKPESVADKATPAEFIDLKYGVYAAEVNLAGYDPAEVKPFLLTGAQWQEFTVPLKRATGGLKITTKAEGAKFILRLTETPAKESGFEPVEKKGSAPTDLTGLPTGKYEITFPEHGATQEVVVEAGAPKELAVLLGPPGPGGASTVALAAGSPVKVTTDKPAYRNGEAVVCSVQIPYDGYLRLYSIDAAGNRVRIFPNAFEKGDKVSAGQTVRVPGNDSYDLKLELPPGLTSGTEAVHAVISPQPFNDEAASADTSNPYLNLGAGSVTEFRTRGLRPQQKADSGQASYQINP